MRPDEREGVARRHEVARRRRRPARSSPAHRAGTSSRRRSDPDPGTVDLAGRGPARAAAGAARGRRPSPCTCTGPAIGGRGRTSRTTTQATMPSAVQIIWRMRQRVRDRCGSRRGPGGGCTTSPSPLIAVAMGRITGSAYLAVQPQDDVDGRGPGGRAARRTSPCRRAPRPRRRARGSAYAPMAIPTARTSRTSSTLRRVRAGAGVTRATHHPRRVRLGSWRQPPAPGAGRGRCAVGDGSAGPVACGLTAITAGRRRRGARGGGRDGPSAVAAAVPAPPASAAPWHGRGRRAGCGAAVPGGGRVEAGGRLARRTRGDGAAVGGLLAQVLDDLLGLRS